MATFRKKWPNRVISEKGFEVRIEGRGTVLYLEGNKTIRTNSEFLAGDEGIGMYRSSLCFWTTPNGKEQVPDAEIREIEENIKAALTFMGIKLSLI